MKIQCPHCNKGYHLDNKYIGHKLYGGAGLKVVTALMVLFLAWVFYLYFTSMSGVTEKRNDFKDLHDAAMDRMSKGPESEFGPEVIDEYSKAAEERKERLLQFQPDFGNSGNSFNMNCGSCGKSVSPSSKVGDKCPHCRVKWVYETVDMKVRHR